MNLYKTNVSYKLETRRKCTWKERGGNECRRHLEETGE